MAKAKKSKAKALSARLQGLVASAASIGFDVATGYSRAVELAKAIGTKNRLALIEAGLQYQSGYVARYLGDNTAYAKRWHNMGQKERLAESLDIIGRAEPESSKANRRSALEHKAVRAAQTSWSTAKRRAGLIAERKGGRKPRPSSNKPSKAVPVDLVKASPKLASKAAANNYFATACAALLATVDKNARLVPPQVSSALTDLRTAFIAAGIMSAPSK